MHNLHSFLGFLLFSMRFTQNDYVPIFFDNFVQTGTNFLYGKRSLVMLDEIKRRLQTKRRQKTKEEQTSFAAPSPQRLDGEITDMLVKIRQQFDNSGDLVCREIQIDGLRIAVLQCESMVNGERLNRAFMIPAMQLTFGANPAEEFSQWLQNEMIASTDQVVIHTYEDLFRFIMSGFVVVLVQGLDYGFALGMQGYAYRSVSEPNYEVNERASREGFVEPIKVNMTMIRRRMKSPKLVFEMMKVGKISNTDVCMCYQTDQVSRKTLEQVRRRLKTIDLDVVLESGYIQPFFRGWGLHFVFVRRRNRTPRHRMRQGGRRAHCRAGGRHALCIDCPLFVCRKFPEF
jgi:hypothetical protein